MKLQRILVAVDFSEPAKKAFEQSLFLAQRGGTEIHVLHRLAAPIPMFPPEAPGIANWKELGRMVEEYTSQLKREAEKELEALVARAPRGVAVDYSIEEVREPVDAVLAKVDEWKPDLLALGTHGRHGLEKLVMGSVATKLLHHAHAAVMLVRADTELFDATTPVGPILVPVDFSDHSHRALALARHLASRFDGSVQLLHAVALLHTPLTPGGLTSRLETEPGLREKTTDALKDMLGDSAGDVAVIDGLSVAGAILSYREELGARLVVMGSRGRTGLPHLLVGSVAEKVAPYCEVPVIVVK